MDGNLHSPDPASPAEAAVVVRQRNVLLLSRLSDLAQERHCSDLLGCLLGLAVGDVLGCPVEGLSSRQIRRRFGAVRELIRLSGGQRWRLPGLHSDDTQQALAVVHAFDDVPGNMQSDGNEVTLAARLAALYVQGMEQPVPDGFGCWRGTGRNFRAVVGRLKAVSLNGLTIQSDEAAPSAGLHGWPFGHGEPSAGLGAVMRIAPVGILVDDFERLGRLAAAVTLITHTDPLATLSACAVAFASRLLRATPAASFSPDVFLHELVAQVQRVEEQFTATGDAVEPPVDDRSRRITSELIATVEELMAQEPDTALQHIAARTADLTGRTGHPTDGFAPAGVAASLYFFLHHVSDPELGLLAAINAGGDTDTIGAVVGALAGTLHGPTAFARFLPDLVGLDLILGEACPDLRPPDLIAQETHFTILESKLKATLPRIEIRQRRQGGQTVNDDVTSVWAADVVESTGIGDDGWAPLPGEMAPAAGQAGALDLSALPWVSKLSPSSVPLEVTSHTRSRAFSVKDYYRLDDVARFRRWRDILDSSGGNELWVFYGCPPSMVEQVLSGHELHPYGSGMPAAFGDRAISLFRRAFDAARFALDFGKEAEGYLISCRLATGRTFRTAMPHPKATAPPRGFDTIGVPGGTDLGFGRLRDDMYATFDSDRVLLRFFTHITHP